MNVSLTEKLEDFVKTQVAGGLYGNASEVVRESLRLLMDQQHIAYERRQWLIEELQKGIDSPSQPWNVEEFIADAHARKA